MTDSTFHMRPPTTLTHPPAGKGAARWVGWHHVSQALTDPWGGWFVLSFQPVWLPCRNDLKGQQGLRSLSVWTRVRVNGIVIASLLWLVSARSAEAGPPTTPVNAERRVERRVVGRPILQSSERDNADEKVETKTVAGSVSGVGPRFIAVEYRRDDKAGAGFEMALPVDEKALVSQKDTLKTLQLGDAVAVEYREATAKDDQGKYTRVKRAATRITVIRRASESPVSKTGQAGPNE